MTEKEQSETLDQILNSLTNLKGQGKSAIKLSTELGVDKNSILHLCEILSKGGYTKDINPTAHNKFYKTFFIEPKGAHKLKTGGFTNDFELELERKSKEQEFKELQLSELKKRLENMEQQTAFHISTTEKNEEQIKLITEKIPLIKYQKETIWIYLGISLLSLILSLISICLDIKS